LKEARPAWLHKFCKLEASTSNCMAPIKKIVTMVVAVVVAVLSGDAELCEALATSVLTLLSGKVVVGAGSAFCDVAA